jgi:hypothetical protein
VIGVVSGYETTGARRGIYVSHNAICKFLHRCEGQGGQPTPPNYHQGFSPIKRGPVAPLPFAPICPPGGS